MRDEEVSRGGAETRRKERGKSLAGLAVIARGSSRLPSLERRGRVSRMSTVAEIESAIETLPPEKVEAVFEWLQAHKAKLADVPKSPTDKPGDFPLFGFWKGNIVYKEGWGEPLEDFKEYMG